VRAPRRHDRVAPGGQLHHQPPELLAGLSCLAQAVYHLLCTLHRLRVVCPFDLLVDLDPARAGEPSQPLRLVDRAGLQGREEVAEPLVAFAFQIAASGRLQVRERSGVLTAPEQELARVSLQSGQALVALPPGLVDPRPHVVDARGAQAAFQRLTPLGCRVRQTHGERAVPDEGMNREQVGHQRLGQRGEEVVPHASVAVEIRLAVAAQRAPDGLPIQDARLSPPDELEDQPVRVAPFAQPVGQPRPGFTPHPRQFKPPRHRERDGQDVEIPARRKPGQQIPVPRWESQCVDVVGKAGVIVAEQPCRHGRLRVQRIDQDTGVIAGQPRETPVIRRGVCERRLQLPQPPFPTTLEEPHGAPLQPCPP
jgi:hypothetical protein